VRSLQSAHIVDIISYLLPTGTSADLSRLGADREMLGLFNIFFFFGWDSRERTGNYEEKRGEWYQEMTQTAVVPNPSLCHNPCLLEWKIPWAGRIFFNIWCLNVACY